MAAKKKSGLNTYTAGVDPVKNVPSALGHHSEEMVPSPRFSYTDILSG